MLSLWFLPGLWRGAIRVWSTKRATTLEIREPFVVARVLRSCSLRACSSSPSAKRWRLFCRLLPEFFLHMKSSPDRFRAIGNEFFGMFFVTSLLLVCTWRHGGHVGSQEQKHFSVSPLGTKPHYHVNYSGKNSVALTPNMATLSVVANQE